MLDAHDVAIKDMCNVSCLICTKIRGNQFIPVYHSAVLAFLEYLVQIGRIPQEIDYMSLILLLLAESSFWKETVFNCLAGSVLQVQVNALFLSLMAAGIIHSQPNSESLQWTIKQVYATGNNGFLEASIGSPFYKMDAAWQGINLFSETHVR
jgi:hypothetical protein